MSRHENPPAFPSEQHETQDGTWNQTYCDGMSLRDYFATHADQPGVSEIVAMAGFQTDGFWVFLGGDGENKQKFNDWWNGLPLVDRFALTSRVRYALADAMLAERSKA